MRPRDHSSAATVGKIRLARTFSNIVSPPMIFAVLGLALAWRELAFWPGLLWAAVFGFFASLAPILFIVYLLRTGRITDLHMNTTQERHLPYLVSLVGSAVALGLLLLFEGPLLLRCLALFNTIVLSVLGLVNTIWLISIHAASIAATALIAGRVFGPSSALLTVPLVILVCWARLFLRRHTPAQVAAGLALGLAAVLALSFTGCFNE
ncbi:MAG: hypothetical protein L0332_14995 [Chloroflexi bacterium]|nr:hypothetical protein [Chloroflexota bacterium]MCI0577080.1 hypothetical protein [Chloroflexota bacterium]MCI0650154.1 hypothetical protein [Chloroflexota bacterium]MCI0728009.1 hypothetical protein [Chloroflexota bacterium]